MDSLDSLLYTLFTSFPRDTEWTKKFKSVIADIKGENVSAEAIDELLLRQDDPMKPFSLESLELIVHDKYLKGNIFGRIRKYYGISTEGIPVRLLLVEKKSGTGVVRTVLCEGHLTETKVFESDFKKAFEKAYQHSIAIETNGLFRISKYCSLNLLDEINGADNPSIVGESAYLSFLIPLLAHDRDRELPTLVAYSGSLPDAEGNVQKVSHIVKKCKAAYKRGIKYVFVHEENIQELDGEENIPQIIQYDSGTYMQVERQIFDYMDSKIIPYEDYIYRNSSPLSQLKEYRENALRTIIKLSEEILDRNVMADVFQKAKELNKRVTKRGIEDIEFQIEYHLLVCDYYNHKGIGRDDPESDDSYKFLEEIKHEYPEHYARAINKRAVGYHDVFCPEEAKKQLDAVLENKERDGLTNTTIGKIYGTMGQGYAYMGESVLAEKYLRKSYDTLDDKEKNIQRTLNYLVHLAADTKNFKLWQDILKKDPCLEKPCPTLNVDIYGLHINVKGVYVFGTFDEKKRMSDILENEHYWKSEDGTYRATVMQATGLLNSALYEETGDECYRVRAVRFFEKAYELFSVCDGLLNDNLQACAKGYLALLNEDEELAGYTIEYLRDAINKYDVKLRSAEFDSSKIWNEMREMCSSSYDDIPALERISYYTKLIRKFQWW